MYVGIREGKVFDICSHLANKRLKDDGVDIDPDSVAYILISEAEMIKKNILVGDTWDFENQDSLKDSPARIPQPDKEDILQEKIQELEDRIKALEEAKGL